MKKVLVGLIAIMIFLVGCSSGGSELKEIKATDLCVTHINFDEKICYGDDMKDVEQITGTGNKTMGFVSYENGVRMMYRDEKVAGISLSEESLNIYEVSYAEIGESKADILKRLGTKNAIDKAPKNLDYFYDTKSNKFIIDLDSVKGTPEDMEQVNIISFAFDDDGNVRTLMLLDQRMAIFMQ